MSRESAKTRLVSSLKRLTSGRGESVPNWSVGADGHYDAIQDALDDSRHDTTPIGIDVRQDYDPASEVYPIKVFPTPDDFWLPTTIEGAGQGVTTIGRDTVKKDIIQVHGPAGGGQKAYHKPVKLSGFTVEGGIPPDVDPRDAPSGIHIAGIPNGTIENVTLRTNGHGIRWTAPYIPMDVSASHSFGWRVRDTEAWGCLDDYRIQPGAGAHQTSFSDCLANSAFGAGLRVRGAAAVTWRGGSIQLCRGYGARIDQCEAFTLRDAYVEGSGREKDFPLELYADGAHGLLVDGCYFHGTNPRTTTHDYSWVQRGVNVHDSEGVTVSNNTVRRYGEGFVAAFNSEVDVHGNELRDATQEFGYTAGQNTLTSFGRTQ